ncbi:MAG TPA: hypothetical protein VGM14_12560 [Streptosporangiaceae bacterium]|jgi:hypothetical protein
MNTPPDEQPTPIVIRVRRMSAYRILCGSFWAALTLIFGIGAFAEFNIGNTGGGVLCVLITIPAAWYDYRVWTFKINRFWFFW